MILISITICVTGAPKIGDSAPEANSYNTSNSSISPYFDLNVVRNVTTTVGQSAFLHCRVYQLGDKSVMYNRLTFYFNAVKAVWSRGFYKKQSCFHIIIKNRIVEEADKLLKNKRIKIWYLSSLANFSLQK